MGGDRELKVLPQRKRQNQSVREVVKSIRYRVYIEERVNVLSELFQVAAEERQTPFHNIY